MNDEGMGKNEAALRAAARAHGVEHVLDRLEAHATAMALEVERLRRLVPADQSDHEYVAIRVRKGERT